MRVRDLRADEWQEFGHMVMMVTNYIEEQNEADVRQRYEYMKEDGDKLGMWFAEKTLSHPNLGETPHGYNQGFNEGVAAGQTVDHLHYHIIPRYKGDVDDPRGGIRHVIPRFGNYQKRREESE